MKYPTIYVWLNVCFLSVIYTICQISDPDCYRLVQGKDIYQSTTLRITTNDTSATIDSRKTELFPLYVLIIIIIIIIVVSFVRLYKRKFIIYILLGSLKWLIAFRGCMSFIDIHWSCFVLFCLFFLLYFYNSFLKVLFYSWLIKVWFRSVTAVKVEVKLIVKTMSNGLD